MENEFDIVLLKRQINILSSENRELKTRLINLENAVSENSLKTFHRSVSSSQSSYDYGHFNGETESIIRSDEDYECCGF